MEKGTIFTDMEKDTIFTPKSSLPKLFYPKKLRKLQLNLIFNKTA